MLYRGHRPAGAGRRVQQHRAVRWDQARRDSTWPAGRAGRGVPEGAPGRLDLSLWRRRAAAPGRLSVRHRRGRRRSSTFTAATGRPTTRSRTPSWARASCPPASTSRWSSTRWRRRRAWTPSWRRCARAVAWVIDHAAEHGGDPRRVFVAGHSAGGHLTAMAMTDPRVAGGVAISGLFDLEPIRLCYLNDKLRLDESEARRNSPIHHLPARSAPLVVTVGLGELPELIRAVGGVRGGVAEAGPARTLSAAPAPRALLHPGGARATRRRPPGRAEGPGEDRLGARGVPRRNDRGECGGPTDGTPRRPPPPAARRLRLRACPRSAILPANHPG